MTGPHCCTCTCNCTTLDTGVLPTNQPSSQLEAEPSKHKPPSGSKDWRSARKKARSGRATSTKTRRTGSSPGTRSSANQRRGSSKRRTSWNENEHNRRRKLSAGPHHSTSMNDEQLGSRSDQPSRGASRQQVLRKGSKEQLMGSNSSKTTSGHSGRGRKNGHSYRKERLRSKRNSASKKFRDKRQGKGKGRKGKKYGRTKKSAQEKEEEKMKRIALIAKPRKVVSPPRPKRKCKPLSKMYRIPIISAPREYDIEPPRDPLKVPSAALIYDITSNIRRLAQPERRRRKYVEEDPPEAAVSKAALRYKPSARILELAKPMERD